MATYTKTPLVLNSIAGEHSTTDLTHKMVRIVWTNTMAHGSLLIPTNAVDGVITYVEAGTGDLEDAAGIIDDVSVGNKGYVTGDVVYTNMVIKGCVLNQSVVVLEGVVVTAAQVEDLTLINGNMNTFRAQLTPAL